MIGHSVRLISLCVFLLAAVNVKAKDDRCECGSVPAQKPHVVLIMCDDVVSSRS